MYWVVAVQESTHFDGQVLVAREAEGHQTCGASHVVDTYEPVAGTPSLSLTFSPIMITITVTEVITVVVITIVIVCVVYFVVIAELSCSQVARMGL